jgi:hypothetical protein
MIVLYWNLKTCHPGQAMRQRRAEPGPIAPLLDGSRLGAAKARLAGMTGSFCEHI